MTDNDSAPDDQRDAAPSSVEGKYTQSQRDADAQAVRDNMARLRALRLAREAAEPARAGAKKVVRARPGQKTKTSSAKTSSGKADSKPQALSDWLASQQTGGRRI